MAGRSCRRWDQLLLAFLQFDAQLFCDLRHLAGDRLGLGLCLGAGFVFGNVPVVKENFSLVALGIVAVSVLPMVVEFLRHRRATGRLS